MTEEERGEIENQIKALQESHSLLSREYKRQQQEAKELVDKLVEQKVTSAERFDLFLLQPISKLSVMFLHVFEAIVMGNICSSLNGTRFLNFRYVVGLAREPS